MNKQSLRAEMRAKRQRLAPEWVLEHSRAAQERLCALHVFTAAMTVGLYLAMSAEMSADLVLASSRRGGKRVAVPARDRACGGYRFVQYPPDATLATGPWGILEPDPAQPIEPGELDLVVVPGVAFDADGCRLGHGGGYYDRLLAELSPTCTKVGLAFDFQVVPQVPVADFDVKMDAVISETRIFGDIG